MLQSVCRETVGVCDRVTLSIVAKQCVLEQKLLLTAYRKSYMRNRLVPKWRPWPLFRGRIKVMSSGGTSYGAKGLKPLQFLLQPLQNFCVNSNILFQRVNFLRTKIKIAVTGCHILWLKCTKIDFFWGSAPDPAGGAYSASQTP